MSFDVKWHLLVQVEVRCYILISNVSGSVKVAPLQILQYRKPSRLVLIISLLGFLSGQRS